MGILLSVLSQVPRVEKEADSTDYSYEGKMFPGGNVTQNLEEVDADNHALVTVNRVQGEPFEGLHYYCYKTSEPHVRKFENWTNASNATDRIYVNISEEGHWYFVMINEGNATVGYVLSLEWVFYREVPIISGRYLTYGILLIIYSVLFISIVFMRDRFKGRGKARHDGNSRMNREKSNTD